MGDSDLLLAGADAVVADGDVAVAVDLGQMLYLYGGLALTHPPVLGLLLLSVEDLILIAIIFRFLIVILIAFE